MRAAPSLTAAAALLAGAWLALAVPVGPAAAEGIGTHVGPADGASDTAGGDTRLGREQAEIRGRVRERDRKLPRKRRGIRNRLTVYRGDDDDDEAPGREVMVVVPSPPETTAEPEPVRPPDPGSPFAGVSARGVSPERPQVRIGAPLPTGVVQVTLDWRTYGLPRPPEGQVYARVGRQILLVEPDSRRVMDVYRPPEG